MSKLLTILLLLPLACMAQRTLTGRVLANGAPVNNVFVLNVTKETETRTTAGEFKLPADPGDKIVIHHPNITSREFVLSEASFKEQPFVITVNVNAYEMNELLIDKQKPVDEVSLRLVPEDQIDLTPAERRHQAAASMRPNMISGIGVPTDAIINAISGRSKMLKKAMATEKREVLLQKVGTIYTTEEVTSELKIPAEYVDGYLFYAIQDADVAKALDENNFDTAKKEMMRVAFQYLENIR